MRLGDVVVGEEYEATPSWRSVGNVQAGRWHVRVVEVRVHRRVFDGWRYRESRYADGVRVVRILDGEDVDEHVVRAAELDRPWDEARREYEARDERNRKAKTRARVAKARMGTLGDRIDALVGDQRALYDSRPASRVDGDVDDSPFRSDDNFVRWVRINLATVDQLARLVEMAELGARCRTERHLDDAG